MSGRASRHKTKLLVRNDARAKNEGKDTAIKKPLKRLSQSRKKLDGPTILREKGRLTRLGVGKNHTTFPSGREVAKGESTGEEMPDIAKSINRKMTEHFISNKVRASGDEKGNV